MPGTRWYFTCEAGEVVVAVAGESWTLRRASAVLVFRGRPAPLLHEPRSRPAVGYSVVLLARVS
jgi:hypothetical protein